MLTQIPNGVEIELPTLAEMVAYGQADPDLLHREMVRAGIVSASHFSQADHTALPSGPPQVAAAPYAGAVGYPLGPPTLSGSTFSIDIALANPTRVLNPMIIDLTRLRFFVDRIFRSAGGVTGGAVVYDIVSQNQAFADRDVQRVEPGTEFPVVAFSRPAPSAAQVEKWGGKFFFTDEARDRNDTGQFTNAMRQLANTIIRKINQRGVQILEALITANSRTIAGVSWGSVVTTTTGQSNWTAMPTRDFAKARLQAEQEEMEMTYNLWILNPQEMFSLEGIYGPDLSARLAQAGISVFVTNRVTAGTAYAVAEGQVGELRVEQGLSTETWRDPNGKQQTWVQSSVRPVMFGNNPFAVLKFTGLT
jgi:hypothetical protein